MDETPNGLEDSPLDPLAEPRKMTLLAHVDWMDVPPEARGTGYVVIDHSERPLPPRGFVLASEPKSLRDRLMAKLRRS